MNFETHQLALRPLHSSQATELCIVCTGFRRFREEETVVLVVQALAKGPCTDHSTFNVFNNDVVEFSWLFIESRIPKLPTPGTVIIGTKDGGGYGLLAGKWWSLDVGIAGQAWFKARDPHHDRILQSSIPHECSALGYISDSAISANTISLVGRNTSR